MGSMITQFWVPDDTCNRALILLLWGMTCQHIAAEDIGRLML